MPLRSLALVCLCSVVCGMAGGYLGATFVIPSSILTSGPALTEVDIMSVQSKAMSKNGHEEKMYKRRNVLWDAKNIFNEDGGVVSGCDYLADAIKTHLHILDKRKEEKNIQETCGGGYPPLDAVKKCSTLLESSKLDELKTVMKTFRDVQRVANFDKNEIAASMNNAWQKTCEAWIQKKGEELGLDEM